MNADKILPILCRYLKDTDNRLLANNYKINSIDWKLKQSLVKCVTMSIKVFDYVTLVTKKISTQLT